MIETVLFIFGLFIGSFLNMLIDRLPRSEQFLRGRSHCDSCKHVLNWYDLLPVVSWILLRGKCRYCKKAVPARNTIVEILTAFLFLANHYAVLTIPACRVYQLNPCFVVEVLSLVILCCLIIIFFIDLAHQIIPDELTVIAGVAVIILIVIQVTPLPLMNRLLSAICAGAFFLFLFAITKGRGMGFGDVKFAVFMGLYLGFPRILLALYTAFLTGAVVSVMLILRRRKKFGQTIAFGPFLIAGTVFAQFGLLDWLWSTVFYPF